MASANGGIKEIAEGKYVVNVSMSPIAPYVGDTQHMLIAVSDIPGNLIAKDIRMDVSLTYENSQSGKDEIVTAQNNVLAHSGVLPFDYTYKSAGIYKLLVKFRLPDEPNHTYEPDDFHIEAKEKYKTVTVPVFSSRPSTSPLIFTFFGGGLLGLLLGFGLAKRS
ncbi:hypothetical protein HY285_04160 [Candidatus Peregrinibacteria bacterium]|nr:hypothetical protein [Candidatus Peregrinibacteria bacterium]MBI3816707.1 hypothetical protein [Candidatus Peregrinibacteria bacterium]